MITALCDRVPDAASAASNCGSDSPRANNPPAANEPTRRKDLREIPSQYRAWGPNRVNMFNGVGLEGGEPHRVGIYCRSLSATAENRKMPLGFPSNSMPRTLARSLQYDQDEMNLARKNDFAVGGHIR